MWSILRDVPRARLQGVPNRNVITYTHLGRAKAMALTEPPF